MRWASLLIAVAAADPLMTVGAGCAGEISKEAT
jgi:hypothetical protein